MKIRMYKTGDTCPCCGKPVKYEDPELLLMLSFYLHVLGLSDEEIPEVEVDDAKIINSPLLREIFHGRDL